MSKFNLCQTETKLLRFLCAFCIILWAALYSPAVRLPLKLYTSADGLASGAIFRVDRDSRGFLWFSTRDGLSRFDGREFVNYRLENQIGAPTFNATLETRDGSFWISASGGLYRIAPDDSDQTEPAAVTSAESELYKFIRALRVAEETPSILFEDSRGRVWGGGVELSLIAENGEIKLQSFDLGAIARDKRGAAVNTIIEGRDGSLWVGCDSGAMRILPDNRRVLYPIRRLTGYDETRSIVEDETGRIWVGHSTGVFVFHPESLAEMQNVSDLSTRTFENEERIIIASEKIVLPESPGRRLQLMFPEQAKNDANSLRQTANISRIFKSSDGKVWVPAGGSLFVFDSADCRRYSDSNGFNGSVTDINEDAGGDIWLATEGGALRFNRAGLTSYGVVEGLTDPRVHSIYETPNGDLFVVHGDWRISRITENSIESTRLNVPDGDRFLWTSTVALLDPRRKNWWALSTNGLYSFAAASENLAPLAAQKPRGAFGQKDGLPSDSLYAAFADSRGNLWFSTRSTAMTPQSGLARLEPETGEWRFFTAADGFPTGAATRSFAEDRNGNIWCGFYGGGLARFDGERFTDYSKQENFPHGAILGLYFDAKGHLWIGSTRDGLNLVEKPNSERLEFKRYTTEQGLASNQIRALAGDARGDIYVGTVRGVDRISPETGAVRHYSPADGLASDAITAVFADRRGSVWFGTPNGLSKLEPSNEISNAKISPHILINNLQIAGVNRNISIFGRREIGEVTLASSENNLNIGFLSVGDNLRYQYKLEGVGSRQDWSRPTTERTVNFAGLAPGNYKFLVRALNAENRASERPAQISFSIAPPFWKTWEFIGAIVFVSAFGVFLLDRYRVAKTRQVETALAKSLESERVARESETRFRTLANTASDAIITIDIDSRIVFVNEVIEKVFGWKPDELIGENLTILMPKTFHRKHHDGLARYASTGRKNIAWNGIELVGLRKSGATVPIEISFGEFDLDGRHYFTGVARDISERKRHEETIQRAREDRFRELQKVRTRIATDLHDDIGSSLTQIAVLTEVARASAIKDEVKAPLERISAVSNELVDAMADIVWAINPKKDSWRELVRRMRRFASDVLSSSDIEFELETPETDKNIQLGANIRREVFSIFKECVNNIVRHSGASFVEIEFEIIVGVLRLKIADDGRGFDASHVLDDNFTPEKGGNGLINIRRRVADLNGICEIDSSDAGTVIDLSIPLHKEHESVSLAIYVDSDSGNGGALH